MWASLPLRRLLQGYWTNFWTELLLQYLLEITQSALREEIQTGTDRGITTGIPGKDKRRRVREEGVERNEGAVPVQLKEGIVPCSFQ